MRIKQFGLILSFCCIGAAVMAAESGWVIVTGEKLNLRSKPDSSGKLVETLSQYSPVKLLGAKEGEYFEAETRSGKTGWAHETYVGTTGYASAKPGKVNWRKGPSKDSEIIYVVDQPDYNPLRILDRQGDYVQIQDFEKDKGWIHVSLLSAKPYCIVMDGISDVRVGPGAEHPVRFRAETRVVLEVLKREGDWLEVRHKDGNSGWIEAEKVWGAKEVAAREMPPASKATTAATKTSASEPAS